MHSEGRDEELHGAAGASTSLLLPRGLPLSVWGLAASRGCGCGLLLWESEPWRWYLNWISVLHSCVPDQKASWLAVLMLPKQLDAAYRQAKDGGFGDFCLKVTVLLLPRLRLPLGGALCASLCASDRCRPGQRGRGLRGLLGVLGTGSEAANSCRKDFKCSKRSEWNRQPSGPGVLLGILVAGADSRSFAVPKSQQEEQLSAS